jgi:hypothetical protein
LTYYKHSLYRGLGNHIGGIICVSSESKQLLSAYNKVRVCLRVEFTRRIHSQIWAGHNKNCSFCEFDIVENSKVLKKGPYSFVVSMPMLQNRSNLPDPNENGIYRGEILLRDGYGKYCGEIKQSQANGRGVETWKNGERYEGDFVQGRKCGHGTFAFADGAIYDGDWLNDGRHGRGAFWLSDGRRCFEGDWAERCPKHGMAVEVDGSFSLVTFREMLPLYDDESWRDAMRSATVTPAGHFEASWPPVAHLADGSRYQGALRHLCPLRGVWTDPDGLRFAVTFCGTRTLAENPTPLSKKVPL